MSERADNILAGILLKYGDSISAEAIAEIREVLWDYEAAALERRVDELEEAARPFAVMRFPDGIAGHDDDGHPLSHEGMARKRLREALAGGDDGYTTPQHILDLMSGELPDDVDDVSPPHGMRYEGDE